VQVSLLPVGAWNPDAKRVEPAPPASVVLSVSSYAHDPNSILCPLA